jgi:hypothetical protein
MRALAYKSVLVICGLVLALGLAVVLGVFAMLLDWEPSDPPLIDPSDLEKIQVGDVVRLSELLKEPTEKVCFLTPYQNRLNEAEPLSQLVNAHLEAIGFELLDNGFALVFVHGDKVSAQRLDSPNRVSDWHPWHQEASRIFKPLGCTSVERALVTRSSSTYLIFGEQP